MDAPGWTLLVAASLFFAGCATPEEGEAIEGNGDADDAARWSPDDYPEHSFLATASDANGTRTYGFEGPASAPAGWARVTLTTEDVEPHQLVFLRLDQGVGYDEFLETLHERDLEQGGDFTLAGGVGGVTTGERGTVLLDLQEGEYALVCLIPGPQGRPHVHDGQVMRFEVTPAEGEALPPPQPDANITMREYAYELPAEGIGATARILAFVNDGGEAHEAPLVRLEDGATLQEFLEVLEAGEGPPPGALIGGVVGIPPGGTGYAVVTLEEGVTYGAVCFYPAGDDGAPHFAHGMMVEFTPE